MGWRSSNVCGSFFDKFTPKNRFDQCMRNFFRDDSFKQCSKIAAFLRGLGGRTHACACAHASEKLRATKFGTCRVPYHEALVRASGKDLAQGQVALLDPI